MEIISDDHSKLIKSYFSYPKHDCPSCTCQCAIIPTHKDLSPKITFLAEKGNQMLLRFVDESIMLWMPRILVDRYFDLTTASSFKVN